MTSNDVVKKAYGEIGVKEYPPNSNCVKYNDMFYGRKVSGSAYPWCCTFIWWLLSSSGIKCAKTASCANLANYFKKENRFFTDNPQVGDIIFFKFKRTNNWTNHVGIVVDVKGNEITTIEGNTSVNNDSNGGEVQLRKRIKNIVGYGRPAYSDASNKMNHPILKRGSSGEYVKAWQNYLISCNISCGKSGADGIFGNDTEKAVKEYQRSRKLPITGIIDQDDWNSVGK